MNTLLPILQWGLIGVCWLTVAYMLIESYVHRNKKGK